MELNLREHQLKVIDSLREGFKQATGRKCCTRRPDSAKQKSQFT
jgi:hypothetical protein